MVTYAYPTGGTIEPTWRIETVEQARCRLARAAVDVMVEEARARIRAMCIVYAIETDPPGRGA